jgi:hypothetical protein
MGEGEAPQHLLTQARQLNAGLAPIRGGTSPPDQPAALEAVHQLYRAVMTQDEPFRQGLDGGGCR